MNCPYCRSKRYVVVKTNPDEDGQSGEIVQQCLECYEISVFHYSKIRGVKSRKQDEIKGLVMALRKVLNDNDPDELERFNDRLRKVSKNPEFFSRRRSV